MNFIWDIILKAESENHQKSDVFFEMSTDCSPWYEQSFSILNEKSIPNLRVEVNPLFRFGDTFGDYFHPDLEEIPEFRRYFTDVALHFLCESDLHKGVTPQDIYKKYIKDEFLALGQRERDTFSYFSLLNQEKFLISYLNQCKTGSSLSTFREMVHHIYPEAILYQIKDEPEEILFYLSEEQNKQNEAQVNLLLDCFLPLYYNVSLFWKEHFGIMEVEQVMKLEKIQLF